MYAVVVTGGKQYRVEKGTVLRVESINGDIGSKIKFDDILMFSDGKNIKIGKPKIDDILVSGQIISQARSKKIIVFKYKKRKRYRRKNGHRQNYTVVRIDNIGKI